MAILFSVYSTVLLSQLLIVKENRDGEWINNTN